MSAARKLTTEQRDNLNTWHDTTPFLWSLWIALCIASATYAIAYARGWV